MAVGDATALNQLLSDVAGDGKTDSRRRPSGLGIYSVVSGSPADRAGVRPNDVITSLGGQEVVDQPSLASTLAALQPGQAVKLEVIRPDGSAESLTVTLGELSA